MVNRLKELHPCRSRLLGFLKYKKDAFFLNSSFLKIPSSIAKIPHSSYIIVIRGLNIRVVDSIRRSFYIYLDIY